MVPGRTCRPWDVACSGIHREEAQSCSPDAHVGRSTRRTPEDEGLRPSRCLQ